jgi:hypothetical protein
MRNGYILAQWQIIVDLGAFKKDLIQGFPAGKWMLVINLKGFCRGD